MSETESLDEIMQDRDRWFLFVLRLIHSDSATRNRILNRLKPITKRPVGRPKSHTSESLNEYLGAFETIKAAASKMAGRKLTDSEVLALPQIIDLQSRGRRLTHINSDELRRERKTKRNILAQARKSRKLLK